MDQLIPIINQLQDTYSRLNMPFMDLPQIVIIGSQSAGKSSVLENIVRREFLPRGTGIVTRCPLLLHLIHDNDPSKPMRGQFLHTGDLEYYDFDVIKEEIIRQTIVLAGPDKNISDLPITLKIYSHDFPNLTLIDLPGLTKVPVESQPKDIDQQIRNICLKFARQQNSIILAVSQGNVDLANSDSLRFAEELDPEGKRTLCVITKLDIMDKGTNAYDILTGKVLRKELGYIGVVSRSQEDINCKKPIDISLAEEQSFFEKHYTDIAKMNGTPFLTQNLNKLLKRHIKHSLPTLKDTINEKIRTAIEKLESFGPEIVDKRVVISQFLIKFSREYIKINEGDFDENLKEIKGGALIAVVLYEEFPSILMKIDIERNLTEDVIKATIQNTCGADKSSFSRQKAFKSLVREQLEKLENPSLKCIDDVYEIMTQFVNQTSDKIEWSNFPNLIDRIVQETKILIRTSFRFAQSLIRNLLFSEKTDVMCDHPNFKLGFVLEKMNYQDFEQIADEPHPETPRNRPVSRRRVNKRQARYGLEGIADTQSSEGRTPVEKSKTQTDHLIENGFKSVCQNVDRNLPEFCRILTYYMTAASKTTQVIEVFKEPNLNMEEKVIFFDQIIQEMFSNSPEILELKNVIVHAMVNTKFYDYLINYELNIQMKKSVELRLPVNKEYEYHVMKSLVIEYFNMVRENVCYYVPKLIKAFLVIHVRENLISHLQCIYSETNLDYLLYEAGTAQVERENMKLLLHDLEKVKSKIDDICKDTF